MKASETILCISPEWHARYDGNRVLLYRYSIESSEWFTLSYRDAVVLTLFDGLTDLKTMAGRLAEIMHCPIGKAQTAIGDVVESYFHTDKKVLVDTAGLPDRDWNAYAPVHRLLSPREYTPSKRLGAPLSLLLMPSNACTTDCIYCYAERKPVGRQEHLSVGRWKELIDEAAAAGVDIATFSGGDPLRYPGLMSLVDRLIGHGFLFMISTKSHVPLSLATRLLDMGFGRRQFQVSIDGWRDEIADGMVRQPGYKAQALDSMRNLLRRGINVRTNTVCTPKNLHDVPNLLVHLARLGIRMSSVAIYGRSLFRHDDAFFLSEDDIRWLKERIEEVRADYPDYEIKFNGSIIDYNGIMPEDKARRWKERARCSGGASSMTICADGRVTLCEQMPQDDRYTAGNLKHQSLLDVWNSPRMLDIAYPPKEKFKDTACYDCDEFDECHYDYGYCFRDSLNAYGTIFCPPPNCPKAPPSPRFA